MFAHSSNHHVEVVQHNQHHLHHLTNPHLSHPHFDRHQLAIFLSSFFTHMFAPASCQECTVSSPYRHIFVDDDFVLLEEDEQDGGPLCREATIEGWKVMTKDRKRRLSVHCFGGL
jgi:hypothetical protein